ncbi:MAG: disulfide bond formation protein B [Ottowia sp.]|nr:disulfide bond formation protein B [Ottowia sp.]
MRKSDGSRCLASSVFSDVLRWGSPFFPLAGMLAALYFQHIDDQLPCALCILQRYAYLGVALGFFCAFAKSIRRVVLRWVVLPFTFAGIGVASWHLWVIHHPGVQCGRDLLEVWVNELPTARWFPDMFAANGFCFSVFEPIFGLSMPTWSLLGMLGMLGLVILQLYAVPSYARGTAKMRCHADI